MWIISIILLVIGLYTIVGNWWIFIHTTVLKKGFVSVIPFVGSISAALGLLLIPVSGARKYFFLPFLLDWSCIVFILFLWQLIVKKHK